MPNIVRTIIAFQKVLPAVVMLIPYTCTYLQQSSQAILPILCPSDLNQTCMKHKEHLFIFFNLSLPGNMMLNAPESCKYQEGDVSHCSFVNDKAVGDLIPEMQALNLLENKIIYST